jgi:hypothetical protein
LNVKCLKDDLPFCGNSCSKTEDIVLWPWKKNIHFLRLYRKSLLIPVLGSRLSFRWLKTEECGRQRSGGSQFTDSPGKNVREAPSLQIRQAVVCVPDIPAT